MNHSPLRDLASGSPGTATPIARHRIRTLQRFLPACFVVSIVLSTTTSHTKAADILGLGNSPCSEYLTIVRGETPKLVSNYVSWVHGYLTGANMALRAMNPNADFLADVTPQMISNRLHEECLKEENAAKHINAVAFGMFSDLLAARRRAKP